MIEKETTLSEAQMTTILSVAQKVAPKFAFGIYDSDDMIQEAIILGMDCVSRYDPERGPFENFVATHISNRLRTFVRKHSVRNAPDVPKSSLDYVHWERSFGPKKRLQEALPLDDVSSSLTTEIDIINQLSMEDIQRAIDKNLPVEYRADYLRMLNNVHVPKGRRNKIKEILISILAEHGYETW
jgi:DNA-directed RNA polymerase specialized sigma24 family protein